MSAKMTRACAGAGAGDAAGGGAGGGAGAPAGGSGARDRFDVLLAEHGERHQQKRRVAAALLRLVVRAGAVLTAGVLLLLIGFILVNGVPYLTPSLFAWEYTSTNVSLMPALINTLLMAGLALLMAVPVGVGSAIYLVEYAPRGSRFVALVRTTTETLQGIPSIIYGLFGMLFFVTALGWGLSLLAGACTLAIMVLPVVMRTTEEALLAVPDSYREGGFGLGAGRLRTVFCCVLPSAVPGILGGVVLALGRCVGEVAALIFTAGSIAQIPQFAEGAAALFDSTRTLAVHMYVLASEGLHVNETYATAVVLLVMVVVLNLAAAAVVKKMSKGARS
ncbi:MULTISPECIES: phosphate ABC transporter permease PstA [Gordonibacter]|uniref:Phosphate transport system permease protein PstA n=1 Tax=Gordonibacter faecis TaxID=3047475 RepID=A0ABT7DJD5_9ACTN|nr:phosphate ABC transporter permease PstA [Gordonibacter sp. KGMB12511]MDJ1649635.1 phosphate ABC transporter permease PstA [Gordonibacter sp. KGMB12511]